MKAVRAHGRGGPQVLHTEDAPLPQIGFGEVLVKVHAAGITPTELTWNSTFTNEEGKERLPIIPGFEAAGTVEKLYPGVVDFALGDSVYGLLDFWRDGAAAEFVAAKASSLARKPKGLEYVSAAVVPLSGLTAWQALFDHAQLKKGDTILIHGAAGGVGTFAVQLAQWCGARVLGTASPSKSAFLRKLGADAVIDYTSTRFEEQVSKVDVVLDTVGGETLERSWKVVRKGGMLVTIVGDAPEEKAREHGIKAVSFLVQPNREQLNRLSELIENGTVRPIVEDIFPLENARQAYERGLLGHNKGKLVLRVLEG